MLLGLFCERYLCVMASGLSCICLIQHHLFILDAAFVAREKAKADAEYYTAAKFAEANRVKKQCWHINTHAVSNQMALMGNVCDFSHD